MKILYATALTPIFLLFFSVSEAKILRIGYPGVALAETDYATFALAHNAAAPGDTIQIYGVVSSGSTVTKRLVIQGFGYNLDMATGLQAITGYTEDAPSQVPLTFQTGSEYSIAEGLQITSLIIQASNITIRRCRIINSVAGVGLSANVQDVDFHSCVFVYAFNVGASAYKSTGIRFYNCIMFGIVVTNTASSVTLLNCSSPEAGGVFNFGGASALVKNCILNFNNNTSANANAVYENNIFFASQPTTLPTGNNNVWGQTVATVYNRLGGASNNPSLPSNPAFDEAWYELKPGSSPALNAGRNAAGEPTNCGIYGGEPVYGYRKGGLPAIPSIYQLTAPSTNTTGGTYNITISVKSNN
ncbi:MAG: hypothetical protein JNL51_13315 [Chitinophagaceae bacterium]|nr:hypothetical protein [Chitinophagaceae bacterium]